MITSDVDKNISGITNTDTKTSHLQPYMKGWCRLCARYCCMVKEYYTLEVACARLAICWNFAYNIGDDAKNTVKQYRMKGDEFPE